ncbi:MAG: phage baseplate assembly protein V [Crocinitomicaceae bacterium]|nr:phage baseplate assembly protein V [Crocinitomicaceae bacterium]
MAESKTIVSIDGKNLDSFETVHLTQGINDHHHFQVLVDMEVVENYGAHTIDASKDWLGKPIVIAFGEGEFLGTIINVQLNHSSGFNGHILISGYSKTILLEGGPHVQSWLEKDLSAIVKDVCGAAGVDVAAKPAFTKPFEYQAQYRETHFQFLQRLAKQHNEWFYYDGSKIIFGKPSAGTPIDVEYGADMDSMSISIEAIPSKQNHFTYNPLEDKKEESKTKDTVAGFNELGEFAFNKSKELFGIVPNGYSAARVKDKSQIDAVIKNAQGSAVAKSNVLRGSSTKLGLTVGSVIKVTAAHFVNDKTEENNHGEFIITSISHSATGINGYSNHFEAISSGVEFLPSPDVEMPLAESQLATVLSNEDPKKKGRVEVQFQWQSGDMKTAWIRVMSPDAGKSDLVGTNRGFVFIPEEDDQVMIGFRYNDPNRPFVMGSMFSGTTGAGGSDANKMKSITTRSGATINIDDDEGDGKITISDPSGNTITLNGDETITISAPSTITMNSKEINLNAEDKIVMKGDNNIEMHSKDILAKSDTKFEVSSGDKIIEGSMTKEESHMKYALDAKDVAINGTIKTDVKGGMVNLN